MGDGGRERERSENMSGFVSSALVVVSPLQKQSLNHDNFHYLRSLICILFFIKELIEGRWIAAALFVEKQYLNVFWYTRSMKVKAKFRLLSFVWFIQRLLCRDALVF